MKTTKEKDRVSTQIAKSDRETLSRIMKILGPLVESELKPIGHYSNMSNDDIWLTLVKQVCVMGSAKHIERLKKKKVNYEEFKRAISLSNMALLQNPSAYIAEILQRFSATRFYQRSADKLTSILRSSSVFFDGRIILLKDLPDPRSAIDIRMTLIDRCHTFGLKSASDFMISVGLSHDVIALDTRIIGLFQKLFEYNCSPGKVNSNHNIYLSLEEELRNLCQQIQVPLSLLDRVLFKFSSWSTIDSMVKYPELMK